MFERYTDRARKAMGYARQDAGRRNHEYIGTEHILIGLAMEPASVATSAMLELGLDVARLRAETDRLVQDGPRSDASGGQLPFTPRARKVMERALTEAAALGHNYIGTEHLLLGLTGVTEGTAARVLANCDVSPERLRDEVLDVIGAEVPRRTEAAGIVIEETSTPEDRKAGRLRMRLQLDLPAEMQEYVYRQMDDLRVLATKYTPCSACDEDKKVQRWHYGGPGPDRMDFSRMDCPLCSDGAVPTMRMQYRNHRGEVAVRHVVPGAIHWGQSQWHPTERWLMRAWDLDKGATRDFDMGEIDALDMRDCPCDGPDGEEQCPLCGDSGWVVGDNRFKGRP